MGTSKTESQEYDSSGRYIPVIFLLYSWGSLFGLPNPFPLGSRARRTGFGLSQEESQKAGRLLDMSHGQSSFKRGAYRDHIGSLLKGY